MQASGGSRSRWGAGQPPGLTAIFFAQLWERLAYYGLLVLLVLFWVDPQAGLGVGLGLIPAFYGLYSATVLVAMLAGGWVVDRWLGCRWSLVLGGLLIVAGLLLAAGANTVALTAGLLLNACGIGLFRPALIVTLSELYGRDDSSWLGLRRAVGFTVVYLGINLGALLGYPLPALVGGWFGWPLGFVAAALAMAAGLMHLWAAARHLPAWRPRGGRPASWVAVVCLSFAGLAAWLSSGRVVSVLEVQHSTLGLLLLTAAVAVFWLVRQLRRDEPPTLPARRVLGVVLGVALIYAVGLELTAVPITDLHKLHLDRWLLGWKFPARWLVIKDFLSLAALSLALLVLWRRLGRRLPALFTRLAVGLLLAAAGWWLVAVGMLLSQHQAPGVGWLLVMSLLAACGDALLVPAGLDAVSSLAGRRQAGRMIAVWLALGAFGKLARLGAESLGLQLAVSPLVVVTVLVALLLLATRGALERSFRL